MNWFTTIGTVAALTLGFWGIAHAGPNNDDQVIGTETVRSVDASGNVVEKRIVKKMRARTVVDFEEASIEGKTKKPNAAYLLHGADLEFKHLYRIKDNQRSRVRYSYEYVR